MREHRVQQGDCLSSIAHEYGFNPDTLWYHGANSELRARRRDCNVLLPGDLVAIPDQQVEAVSCATDQRHRFRRRGVPAFLRLRLLVEDEPRAGESYVLEVDGVEIASGVTNSDGLLEERIPPNAVSAALRFADGSVVALDLGELDPIDTISGVQGRLLNLGYDCGDIDGALSEQTHEALRAFQTKHGLAVTGEPDEATKSKLADLHADHS
jgi:N-acetylmuramoyl-L-alanine amidase